ILYDQVQIYYFLYLVEPYIHSSMKRKRTPKRHTHSTKKRTTIYLPVNIQLTKPTKEIHNKLVQLQTISQMIMDRNNYIDFYKDVILAILRVKETKGYQVILDESSCYTIESIKNRTGLTTSKIISICFKLENKLPNI
ncbi:endonuclease, partial [Neobacillus drentensis]